MEFRSAHNNLLECFHDGWKVLDLRLPLTFTFTFKFLVDDVCNNDEKDWTRVRVVVVKKMKIHKNSEWSGYNNFRCIAIAFRSLYPTVS